MRRICLLLPCFLLLCACSKDVSAQIAPFYQSASTIHARLAVTVDSGTQASDFVLDWAFDGAVNVLTVAEPVSLAGLTLRADPDGRTLLYDDAVLTLPADDGAYLSPLEMLMELFACWREGYYESASTETAGDLTCVALRWRVTADDTDSAELATLFDAQTLLPQSFEYILGGQRRMSGRVLTVVIS